MKKFICTVCGYIHEGDAAPEKCPLCKAPASKFNEMVETEGGLEFADQHVIGVAKGCDEEMIKDLNNHFMGECTEVCSSDPKILEGKHECISSKKIMDVVEFLHDVLKVDHVPGKFPHVVSVHNSCHGVRELGLSSPSERHIKPFNKIIDLLNMVEGITIHEPERKDECCGFGGMFSIEEPAVSTRMGEDKIKRHMATGAEYVTGPDSSCLMHMAGIAKKENMPIKFIHVVQILAAGL